ncbi:methyl-accepting chemotaxis protein [Agrobacterium fabacearum]|uniref:methyl-accepting chemotaxis protein n=1 Tax=Agrobacterium tumefaciens TaxID=358 RepID=UPI0028532CA4|nr:methyl-accepting chemotaxis protein [Agrobacterium tumefaciens]MDR5012548.1 methyl-accepting chemotaxis protein [Agrobacterium tumefaciens]
MVSKKIGVKILLILVGGMLLCMLPTGIYMWKSTREATGALSNDIMVSEAQQAAALVNTIIAEYDGAAHATASAIEASIDKGLVDRSVINGLLRAKMDSFKLGFNAWFIEDIKWVVDGASDKKEISETTNKEGLFASVYTRDNENISITTFEKMPESDWYRIPMETGKGAITTPWLYPVGTNPPLIATLAYPIRAGGKVVGFTGNDVNLQLFSKQIAKMAPLGTGHVSIIAPNGTWIANPKENLIGKLYNDAEGRGELMASLKDRQPRSLRIVDGADGIEVQRTFMPFKVAQFDTTWIVAVDVPVSTIEAPLEQQFYAMMAGSAAVGCLLILVTWAISRIVVRPLQLLSGNMLALAEGDLSVEIASRQRRDEIGEMANALKVFRDNEVRARDVEAQAHADRQRHELDQAKTAEVEQIRTAEMSRVTALLGAGLKRLSQGDLAFQLSEPFAPDFEALRADFNSTTKQLAETLRAVAEVAAVIDIGSREVSSGADDLSRRTEQQAASLEQTAAALDEITTNIITSSKRTEEARDIAIHANASATHSGRVVGEAGEAMRKIEQSSMEITNIISVIDEIAFQTNLLALNAGVEAARAGEAGQGFAVVAQEVRELAQRSAQAAKEIKDLIHNSSIDVQSGVKLVTDTSEALRAIESSIASVNHHIAGIAISAQEQSAGLAEVNAAVNDMDQVTQMNAAMVEQTSAAGASLAQECNRLRELVAKFRLVNDQTVVEMPLNDRLQSRFR